MRVKRLFLFVLVTVLLAACVPDAYNLPPPPTAAPTVVPTPPVFSDPPADALQVQPPAGEACLAQGPFPPTLPGVRYGVNAFLLSGDTQRTLALVSTASFSWVRQQIHWRDIEGERGSFVWEPLDAVVAQARANDLDLMLSVVNSPPWATATGRGGLADDPSDFAAFMGTLARRYNGVVAAYEVWNEPNLARENGGAPARPAHYLANLQAAYAAIKAADPCALVLAAPLAATATADTVAAADDLAFYEELYALDDRAFLHAADALAVHPGGGPHPPDARWPADAPDQSRFYFRHIERIRALMERNGDTRQVWITEVGWAVTRAAGAPSPVSVQEQARYLAGTLRRVREHYPWVVAVFVWNLNFGPLGEPSDEKSTFSILNDDWAPRPAYLVLQRELHALREQAERAAPLIFGEATHRFDWLFQAHGKMRTRPVTASDGTIYVASDPGYLYALSPAGGLRWRYAAPGETRDAPALGPGGLLVLGDGAGYLTLLDPGGQVRWQVRTRGPVRGSPIVSAGRIYVATAYGALQAFDFAGSEVWWHNLGAEATPAVRTRAGQVLVASTSGVVYRLNRDGQVVWQVRTGRALRAAPTPTGDQGAIVAAASGQVLAFDRAGHIRWQHHVAAPIVAAPLVTDRAVYVAARDGALSALAAGDGTLRWRYTTGSDLTTTPVLGADGTLYIGADDHQLRAIRPDGRLLWRAHVRGMVRGQPTIALDGAIYFTVVGGRLYAFAPWRDTTA